MLSQIPEYIRNILSIIAIIIGIIAYLPYLYDIFRNKINPSSASWIVWGIISFVSFGIQWINGAGYSSLITLLAGILSFAVAILGIKKSNFSFSSLDKGVLLGTIIGIYFWIGLKNDTFATIVLSAILFIGAVPTIKSVYKNPLNESISFWSLMFIQGIIGILSRDIFVFNTVFYLLVNTFISITILLIILKKRV